MAYATTSRADVDAWIEQTRRLLRRLIEPGQHIGVTDEKQANAMAESQLINDLLHNTAALRGAAYLGLSPQARADLHASNAGGNVTTPAPAPAP